MDVRMVLAFAEEAAPGGRVDVTELCGRLGISRQTYYLYRRRFAAEGVTGLLPRSRRPRSSPTRVSPEMEERIVGLRRELGAAGWDNGALSIFYRLRRAGVPPPAVSTIHRVLVRHGLVAPQPQKRPRASWRRFEFSQPNGCWQLDATRWALADARPVDIFRVLDDHSRRMLAFRVAGIENSTDAWLCVAEAIRRCGRPALLLTDNSQSFRATDFIRNLAAVGTTAITSRYYHPQTCGKKEREHSTLKKWLRAQPPAATVAALSAQLQAYDLLYNEQRPHQALGGATPAERYAAASPAGPAPDRPPRMQVQDLTATDRGVVVTRGFEIQLGREWSHAPVTLFRHDLEVAVFYQDRLVRALTLDPDRYYQPLGRARWPRHPRVHQPPPLPTAPPRPTRRGTGAVNVERPQRSEDERR